MNTDPVLEWIKMGKAEAKMRFEKTSEQITFKTMAKVDRIEDEFLFVENPESLPGPGLILHTKPPFLMGEVVNFKTRPEMWEFLNDRVVIASAKQCKGYLVCIVPILPLLYSSPITESELSRTCEGMANFYLEKKILKNEGYYKRLQRKKRLKDEEGQPGSRQKEQRQRELHLLFE